MTERELRRLSRSDLLELLLTQRRENEQLRCRLDQAEARLAERAIQINKAGSLAEASLQLSGIFDAAQDSCQYYLDNIRLLSERQSAICQQMEAETREQCDRMIAEAEFKAQQCWDNCSLKIRHLMESCTGLQQAMNEISAFRKNGNHVEGQHY